MRRLAILLIACTALVPATFAETSVQVRVGGPSLELDFLFTDYYGLSHSRMRQCSSVLDEHDLLVALHLVRISGVDFEIIARWRRDGQSWDEITRRSRHDCSIYYVALPKDARPGPPFGRAYGHWRKHPKGDLRLEDEEVHALVLLRALSEHSGVAADEVARLQAKGERPRAIAARRGAREDTASPARGQAADKAEKRDAGTSKAKGKSGKP